MQGEDKCAATWQKQMKEQRPTDKKMMNFNGLITCISCIYSCRYHLQVFDLLLLNLFLLGKKKGRYTGLIQNPTSLMNKQENYAGQVVVF